MTLKKKVYLASFIAPIVIMIVAWTIDGFFTFGTNSLMAVSSILSLNPLEVECWEFGASTC